MKKFLNYKGKSIWKGYSHKSKLNDFYTNRVYVIKKKDLGKECIVYNGKIFYKFFITSKHFGFKVGQFFFSKKMGKNIHLKNVKVTKKNKDKKNLKKK